MAIEVSNGDGGQQWRWRSAMAMEVSNGDRCQHSARAELIGLILSVSNLVGTDSATAQHGVRTNERAY